MAAPHLPWRCWPAALRWTAPTQPLCSAIDQRGRSRPFGTGCDIGAFESSPPYAILGAIAGYLSASGTSVDFSAGSTSVDAAGHYALRGLAAGNYRLTPAAPDAVFVESNRLVTLGPDAVYVDFHAYRSNALTIERLSGDVCRNVFAGAAGETWQVLTSTHLPDWSLHSTRTVQPSGLFEVLHTNAPAVGSRFFRTVKP